MTRARSLANWIGQEVFDALAAWCHAFRTLFISSNANDALSHAGIVVVEFGSSETIVIDPSAPGGRPLGSIAQNAPNAGAQFSSMARSGTWPRSASRGVVVRLNTDQVLQRTIQLPNARLWALRRATQYELERVSPLETKRIVVDVQLIGRDRATKRAILAVRIIKRDLVDHILGQCRRLGLQVAGLQFPDTLDDRPWRGFPIDRGAAARTFSRRRSTALLGGLALGLIACDLGVEYLRGASTERAVVADTVAEKERADALRTLRANIEATQNQIEFFSAQRKAPLLVILLTDLSGLVPNDAWATDVELSRDSVRIRGYAASASRLIGIFDDSQRFAKPRFGAPLVRGPAAGSERFDLTAEIESAL